MARTCLVWLAHACKQQLKLPGRIASAVCGQMGCSLPHDSMSSKHCATSVRLVSPPTAGPLERQVGRLPISKLIFMSSEQRIAELRPFVEQQFAGRASLTTAIPGMLEVRLWAGWTVTCQKCSTDLLGCYRKLRRRALVLASGAGRAVCVAGMQAHESTVVAVPPTLAGAAAGRFQGLWRQLAAGAAGGGPLCRHGPGRW